MDPASLVTLYRPVGQAELDLIYSQSSMNTSARA